MKLSEAKSLKGGEHLHGPARNGRIVTVKVNGKAQVWKTRPDEVRVPCKYGLYEYFDLTQRDIGDWELGYAPPSAKAVRRNPARQVAVATGECLWRTSNRGSWVDVPESCQFVVVDDEDHAVSGWGTQREAIAEARRTPYYTTQSRSAYVKSAEKGRLNDAAFAVIRKEFPDITEDKLFYIQYTRDPKKNLSAEDRVIYRRLQELNGLAGFKGQRKLKNPAMSTPVKAAIGVGLLAAIGGAAWYFTKK